MKRPLVTVTVRLRAEVEEAIIAIARAFDNDAKLKALEAELRAKKDELACALETATGTAPTSGAGGTKP